MYAFCVVSNFTIAKEKGRRRIAYICRETTFVDFNRILHRITERYAQRKFDLKIQRASASVCFRCWLKPAGGFDFNYYFTLSSSVYS